MPKINVAKAFNLNLSPGEAHTHFPVGEHKVSQEVADHWYVQQHLVAGGPSGAAQARSHADEAFLAAKAAFERYEALEKAAQVAEKDAGVKVSAPAHVRLAKAAAATPEPEADPASASGSASSVSSTSSSSTSASGPAPEADAAGKADAAPELRAKATKAKAAKPDDAEAKKAKRAAAARAKRAAGKADAEKGA